MVSLFRHQEEVAFQNDHPTRDGSGTGDECPRQQGMVTPRDLFRSNQLCAWLNIEELGVSNPVTVERVTGESSSKKNQNKANGRRKPAKQSKQKSKPRGSLGRSLMRGGLGALGSVFGPTGAGVGQALGDWGATILGMGDYEMKSNSLMSEVTGVPTMHGGSHGIRIKHKEYLGDITGSTGFSARTFVVQPGSSTTFPWLSNIAGMFQEYKIKGIVFEFLSTSATALNSVNTALGSVLLGVQYNVALPTFQSEAEMLQTEGTIMCKPSSSIICPVECDPNLQVMHHLFTRTGVLPAGADYQFYDWCNFTIGTVGMQAAANIGKLWVSYDIEFSKPRMAYGGSWPGDFTRINNGPYTAASSPLGDIQTNPKGNLGVTITAGASGFQRIFFPSSITSGKYYIEVEWTGAVNAAVTYPGRTLSNCALVNDFYNLSSTGELSTPQNGTSCSRARFVLVVTISGYSSAGSYVEFDTLGTLPATPTYCNIFVVNIPATDSVF